MTVRNVTRRTVTTTFRSYGQVTIPAGRVATATGQGGWFLDDWSGLFEPGSMEEHDAEFYGLPVPPEAFEPTKVKVDWIMTDAVSFSGPELLVKDVLDNLKAAVPGSYATGAARREPVFVSPDSGEVLYYWARVVWHKPPTPVMPAQEGGGS